MSDTKGEITIEDTVRIAKEVRDTLMLRWNADGGFVDKNKMKTRGIMPEAIGLTSLMLIGTAFNEVPNFHDGRARQNMESIVRSSVNFIYEDVNKPHPKNPDLKKGFTAEPLFSAEQTAKIFSDKNGYTDTVTYVMSTMILARYNQRCGYILLDQNTTDRVFELIRMTVKHIINGQIDTLSDDNDNVRYPGTWGFKTYASKTKEHTEDNSLYFTYACYCSITDFFNYVFGEIRQVEDINAGTSVSDYDSSDVDTELIDYLNRDPEIGDVYNALNTIRERTSVWLLEQALPRLPRLSDCLNMDKRVKNVLGISVPDMKLDDTAYEGVNYLYLYPTYYLLDMLTSGYMDRRFHAMIDYTKNPGFMNELKDKYKGIMTGTDRVYFFREESKADLYDEYYKGYLEQAIQSSRFRFLDASRTGAVFWTHNDAELGSKSELELRWVTTDDEERALLTEITNGKWPREPALIPMSVKSNICFSYYISKERDFSIDKMFNSIVDDRSTEEDDDHVKGLWDSIAYNLPVTERSVEALVDYFDYQNKFPRGSYSPMGAGGKSELELAMEHIVGDMIDERMGSRGPSEGQVQPKASPAAMIDVVSSIKSCDIEQRKEIMESLVSSIMPDIVNLKDVSGYKNEDELLVMMTRMFMMLQVQAMLLRYKDAEGTRQTRILDPEKLERKFRELSATILNDPNLTSWSDLFTALLSSRR